MTHSQLASREVYPDPHHDTYSKTTFGFWIYLLTDLMLFGTLFAAYAVLHKSTFGGPSPKELFHFSNTYLQTYILLISSFTVGLAGAMTHRRNKKWTIGFYAVTFVLGVIFTWIEFAEFARLIESGNSWMRSGYLSAFFTLIATLIAHMIFALLWMIVLIIPVCLYGVQRVSIRRLTCLRMFWQFLNIVWIFIFTIVYLFEMVQ